MAKMAFLTKNTKSGLTILPHLPFTPPFTQILPHVPRRTIQMAVAHGLETIGDNCGPMYLMEDLIEVRRMVHLTVHPIEPTEDQDDTHSDSTTLTRIIDVHFALYVF